MQRGHHDLVAAVTLWVHDAVPEFAYVCMNTSINKFIDNKGKRR